MTMIIASHGVVRLQPITCLHFCNIRLSCDKLFVPEGAKHAALSFVDVLSSSSASTTGPCLRRGAVARQYMPQMASKMPLPKLMICSTPCDVLLQPTQHPEGMVVAIVSPGVRDALPKASYPYTEASCHYPFGDYASGPA